MSQSFNTCFIDTDAADVSQQFVEKRYLLDVYPNLINPSKRPSLWLWGSNNNGGLGDNTTLNRSSPVQTISSGTNWRQVVISTSLTTAIKTDGTLWVWGLGSSGQLGTNTTVPRSSPVQTVSGGTNWRQVCSGASVVASIKTDGTLWLWGSNSNGQLGTNISPATVGAASSPVQTVSGGTNWKQVSPGGFHTISIKSDNTLWIWGVGSSGQLGTNTVVSQSSPVQTVSGGANWKQVSAYGGHTGAVKTDGTLWLWGCNSYGRLGTNSTISQSSPVQTVSGGTNWKQVAAGSFSTAAIKTDGTLWIWGFGSSGGNVSSPIQTVAGGTNWRLLSSGYSPGSVKTDGTLWVFGRNGRGQLGDNSLTTRTSPVQTVLNSTAWKSVSVGFCSAGGILEIDDW